ncbi:alpha-amylase family protein [Paenibacillus sp. GCM10027628]|uniref:alpha-amylase family protein n=1 Tax=Paenibacillus sp. GCM10027628 TaxID=3273413 RepID=UPI0036309714
MNAIPWFKKPLRIVDFIPPNPELMETLDYQEEFLIRKELGFNAEHVEVHDVTLGDAGICFYPSEYAVRTGRNILKEISENYDSIGINPIVYVNVHWISPSLAEIHPEWIQVSRDGSVIPSYYGAGNYHCVNSPYRDSLFGTIRTIAEYNIKGIFLDGPVYRVEGCFCEYCAALFQEQYGYSLSSIRSAAEHRDFFDFKRSSIARFMKDSKEALSSVNPNAIIYMNSPQLTPTRYCGRDNRMTVPYQDLLIAEGGFLHGNLRETPIWKPAATAMLLETQAQGKPYCVAIAGRLAPWSRYLLSAAETWIVHAMAVAHGASTWYGVYNDNNRDAHMQTVKQINSFLEQNVEYYTDTRSEARTALLWSYDTANYYQSSAEETDFTSLQDHLGEKLKGDARGSFMGWFDALSRSQVLIDIIDETSLTDNSIFHYRTLILPGISCMSEEQAEQIKRFVRNGGNLIATFDTSVYDEYGQIREYPLLADLLGITTVDEITDLPYDHIQTDKNRESYLHGIDQSLIPAPMLAVKIKPQPGSQTIMHYRSKQPARYCDLPPITSHPFMVMNRFEKGSTLYFTGNVDKGYEHFALPEYRKLMRNALTTFHPERVILESHPGIESLHLSLRSQPQRLMLHLINYTGSMTRPIEKVIPLHNITIRLNEMLQPVTTIRSLRTSILLPFQQEGDSIRFVLPQLDEYEVIVIE